MKFTRQYNGPDGNEDELYAVAVAPDGSVYVAGYTNTDSQGYNAWLRKYR